MQLIPILLLAAVLAADAGVRMPGAPEHSPWISAAVALMPVLVAGLLGWTAVHLGLRGLDRHRSVRPLLRAERLIHLLPIPIVLSHAISLLYFDWLGAIRGVVGNPVIVDEMIAIVPPMAALLLLRFVEFPLERRVRDAMMLRQLDAGEPLFAPPSRSTFVTGILRMQLAFAIVPILMIIGISEVFDRVAAMEAVQIPAWAEAIGPWSGALLVLISAPLLTEWLLDVRRPGPGGFRSDVEGLARRHRIRIGRLLVWRTGGGMVNAAVMGVVPMLRRMLVTDALLEQLRSDEVRAVIAHEFGHLRHRHLGWTVLAMVAILFSSVVAIGIALSFAQPFASATVFHIVEILAYIVAVAGMFVLFGWISRRFEQQADAFAVRILTEDPGLSRGPDGAGMAGSGRIDPMGVVLMQETLERVTRLNGSDPRRRSWRHGSVRARQAALAALAGADPARLPIDRQVRGIKVTAITALAAAAAAQALAVMLFPV